MGRARSRRIRGRFRDTTTVVYLIVLSGKKKILLVKVSEKNQTMGNWKRIQRHSTNASHNTLAGRDMIRIRRRPVTSPQRPSRSPDNHIRTGYPRGIKWPCNWNFRNAVRPLCKWIQGAIHWFQNMRKRVCGQANTCTTSPHKPHNPNDTNDTNNTNDTKRRRHAVNLQITVPGDITADWTFPSPLTAQKQRIFAGVHPFDMSVCVLPYSTKMMGRDSTPPWKFIRTPCI